MNYGVIVYAYVLPGNLHRLLTHLIYESQAHVYLFLHSDIPLVVNVCEEFAQNERVLYYSYGVNRGLARSVNEGLIDGYQRDGRDVMLTANDDMLPSVGDVDKIAQAAINHRDHWIVEGMGIQHGNPQPIEWFAAINPIALETIGYFDENFFPAYFEDVDYRYRAHLAGLKKMLLPDTHIVHEGSHSLTALPNEPLFHDQFQRSQSYFLRKWGGLKDYELFQHPFNNPAMPLKIEADNRHAPYPGYNRADLAVTGEKVGI